MFFGLVLVQLVVTPHTAQAIGHQHCFLNNGDRGAE